MGLRSALHLGVLDIENGVFVSLSTKVANLFIYVMLHIWYLSIIEIMSICQCLPSDKARHKVNRPKSD